MSIIIMTILFISDMHLSDDRPEMTQLFLHFLQTQAAIAEALYILGDMFELWVGDDYETLVSTTVSNALYQLSLSGVPIYFIHGNRDFLMGKKFAKKAGITILPDKSIIDIYGTKTLLMHGDTLCTHDIDYLKYRRKVRNPIVQFLFLRRSLSYRINLAQQLRQKSSTHTKSMDKEIMDVTPSEIPKVLNQYQADLLIHGHTHRPSIELLNLNQHFGMRIVLSDWHNNGQVLVCEPSGEKRLINF